MSIHLSGADIAFIIYGLAIIGQAALGVVLKRTANAHDKAIGQLLESNAAKQAHDASFAYRLITLEEHLGLPINSFEKSLLENFLTGGGVKNVPLTPAQAATQGLVKTAEQQISRFLSPVEDAAAKAAEPLFQGGIQIIEKDAPQAEKLASAVQVAADVSGNKAIAQDVNEAAKVESDVVEAVRETSPAPFAVEPQPEVTSAEGAAPEQPQPEVEAPQPEQFNWKGNYNASVSYSLNDLAATGGVVYQSLQNGNLGNNPAARGSKFWKAA